MTHLPYFCYAFLSGIPLERYFINIYPYWCLALSLKEKNIYFIIDTNFTFFLGTFHGHIIATWLGFLYLPLHMIPHGPLNKCSKPVMNIKIVTTNEHLFFFFNLFLEEENAGSRMTHDV